MQRRQMAALWAGCLAGVLAMWTWSPPSTSPEVVELARRVESGRLQDLLAVDGSVAQVLTSSAARHREPAWQHGLWAEARARRWADYGGGIRDGPVPLPPWARTDPHLVAQALWGLAEVEPELTRRIEADPSAVLLEARGRLRWTLGRTEEALRDLVQAQALEPRRRHTRWALARLYADTGAVDAAEDLILELQADFPEDPALWIAAFRRQPDWTRQWPFPSTAHPHEIGRRDLWVAWSEGRFELPASAIQAYPDRPAYQRMLGDFSLAGGRPRQALAHYRRVERMQDGPGLRVAMARARFQLRLRRCTSDLPTSWGRLVIRPAAFAGLRFEADDRLFPEDGYEEIVAQPDGGFDPQQMDHRLSAANRVGLARLCLADRPSRAARYLARAARIEEGLVATELRARALIAAGRPEEAAALFEADGAHGPQDQGLWASALAASGRLEEASDLVAQVRSSTSVVIPQLLLQGAQWDLELGRYEAVVDAVTRVRRVMTLEPQEVELEVTARFRLGQVGPALALLQDEFGLDHPGNRPEVRYLLGRALADSKTDLQAMARAESLLESVLDAEGIPDEVWLTYVDVLTARSAAAARRAAAQGARVVQDPNVRRALRRAARR